MGDLVDVLGRHPEGGEDGGGEVIGVLIGERVTGQPELQEGEHAAGHHGERERRVGRGEPPGPETADDVPQRLRGQPAVGHRELGPGQHQDPGYLRLRARQPARQPDAHREDLGRVGHARARGVERAAEVGQQVEHGLLEQLGLGGEVVVERPEADVGLVGDVLHGHLGGAAPGQDPLRRTDQRGPGPGPAATRTTTRFECWHPPNLPQH